MTAVEESRRSAAEGHRKPRTPTSPVLLLVAVGVVLLKYGVSWHPEWARLQDAAAHWPDLASSPLITAGDRSLLSNITLVSVAGALGAVSIPAYFALSGLVTLTAIALPFLMRWNSPTFARLSFIVIAGGALAPVLLAWVGGYDAVVATAAIVAGLSRRVWLSAAGWFVLGFSHSAVAAAALVLWLPVMLAADRGDRRTQYRRALAAGASVALGWILIRSLTDVWGGSTDRLALFRAIEPSGLAASFANAAPLVLFGALGVGWLILVDQRVWRIRSSRVMLVVALVGSLGLPLIAVDQTRIVALALIAAVMAWIDDLARRFDSAGADHGTDLPWRLWMVAAAIIPVPVVWMGVVLYPGWATIDDWVALLRG